MHFTKKENIAWYIKLMTQLVNVEAILSRFYNRIKWLHDRGINCLYDLILLMIDQWFSVAMKSWNYFIWHSWRAEVLKLRRNGAPPWPPDAWGNTMLWPLRNQGLSEPNRLQRSNHPPEQNCPGFWDQWRQRIQHENWKAQLSATRTMKSFIQYELKFN